MEIGDGDLRWIPKLRLGDRNWRWRLEIGDGDWRWRLEMEIGDGDWRWRWEMGAWPAMATAIRPGQLQLPLQESKKYKNNQP